MSVGLLANLVLLACLVPCAIVLLRSAHLSDWMVAQHTSRLIALLAVPILAHAIKQPALCDLAVALAVMVFPAGLFLAQLLERWWH